jgi:hypothetical protein
MPKLDLYKVHKRVDVEQKASIAYGDRLIKGNFPSDELDTEAWDIINLMPKQLPETYKITYLLTAESQEGHKVLIRPWPEKKDPFTQANLLDNEDDQTQDLIFRIRTSTSIPYRERLANRLLTLFNDAKEEDPASLGIVFGSLHDFYNFLQLHTNLKYPSITLSPDNNILASWRSKQSHVFNVHFLSNKDVRFVIFKPNKKYPDRKFRFSGAATIDTLMDEMPKNMLDWIT